MSGGTLTTISIHTLHTEGDGAVQQDHNDEFISIHTLHTEGDNPQYKTMRFTGISIHTLHTEGDWPSRLKGLWNMYFNPHPPHGG